MRETIKVDAAIIRECYVQVEGLIANGYNGRSTPCFAVDVGYIRLHFIIKYRGRTFVNAKVRNGFKFNVEFSINPGLYFTLRDLY